MPLHEIWKAPMAREIGAALAFKVLALAVLWYAFFSGPSAPGSHAAQKAAPTLSHEGEAR